MSKKFDHLKLEKHLQYAADLAWTHRKWYFLWSNDVFDEVEGMFKTESDFIKYVTPEKTVRRYSRNDRQFPLDKTVIHTITNNKETFEEATVHTGFYADEYTRSYHALALTIGSHIYFRNGAYKPETEEGRSILAHELTHVAQNSLKGFVDNSTKDELELAAELNEKNALYDTDPFITKKVNGKDVSLKKSVWKKIKRKCLLDIERFVEDAEMTMGEEDYLKLLLNYDKWLDREADEWLI